MRIIYFSLFFFIQYLSVAQDITKDMVKESIQKAADYTITAMQHKDGYSKCDYDIAKGEWFEYEPAWHTGQMIWALLEAHKVVPNKKYVKAATKAGSWWVGLEFKNGSSLDGLLNAEHKGTVDDKLLNFTTIADGTPGLFELSRKTRDPKYAQVATRSGDWGIKNLYIPEKGLLYDIVNAANGEIWKNKSPFYKGDTLPLNLVARPNNEGFLYGDMYLFTKNEVYKNIFISLCNSLVEKQDNSGLWMDYHPNNRKEKRIHPIFNIWNAKSLLKGYEITADKRYLEAAYKTGLAMQKLQQKDGVIYYLNRTDGTFDRSSQCGSAVAFVGILWMTLKQYGYQDFDVNIRKSKTYILKNQFPKAHPDPNLRGAYFETWQKNENSKAQI